MSDIPTSTKLTDDELEKLENDTFCWVHEVLEKCYNTNKTKFIDYNNLNYETTHNSFDHNTHIYKVFGSILYLEGSKDEVIYFVNKFGHLVGHHVDLNYTTFVASLTEIEKMKTEFMNDVKNCLFSPPRFIWTNHEIIDLKNLKQEKNDAAEMIDCR